MRTKTKSFLARLDAWQINVRNAVDAVKKNSMHFAALLTTIHREFHRISYKNHRIRFQRLLNFTRNLTEVSGSWHSGIKS